MVLEGFLAECGAGAYQPLRRLPQSRSFSATGSDVPGRVLGTTGSVQETYLGLAFEDQQTSLLLAYEWRYAAQCAWMLQILTSSAVGATRELSRSGSGGRRKPTGARSSSWA